MKNSKFSFMIILCLIIAAPSCQQATEKISDSDTQVVKQEVKTVIEQSAAAASRHDTEAIMKFFWNDEDLVYAANGYLTKGWSDFNKVVKAVHTDPKNQDFRLAFEDTYVKVINRECALVTGKGKLIDFPSADGPVDKNLTVTFLVENIEGKWLITACHESTPENLF